MILQVFQGFCMALADSVPGVSGGTVAFLLGFYDRFLGALHALLRGPRKAKAQALRYLSKLGVGWCVGMGLASVVLAGLFHSQAYALSSLFLGLTLACFPFLVCQEKATLRARPGAWGWALLGVALVILLSRFRGAALLGGAVALDQIGPGLLYLFLAGALAITAMVLPGISGSTLLLAFGVYVPVIHGVGQVVKLDFAPLPGLLALGCGVLVGVFLSIRCIRNALRRHRPQMLWFILGLMVGSLYAITQGPATMTEPMAPLSLSTFCLPAFLLGVALLLGLEGLRRVTVRPQDGRGRKALRPN